MLQLLRVSLNPFSIDISDSALLSLSLSSPVFFFLLFHVAFCLFVHLFVFFRAALLFSRFVFFFSRSNVLCICPSLFELVLVGHYKKKKWR